MKHILITGGGGQVGLELARLNWGPQIQIHAPSRADLDIADAGAVRARFSRQPYDAVINAAAYTAVDLAEDNVAAAFAANAQAPAVLADETRKAGIPLIHVSTDYVFDGAKTAPYVEDDPVAPLGVYGASKLAGEWAILRGHPRAVILRTAWVLSAHRANFLKTMRRLAETRSEISVVADQIGCPTGAADIAAALATLARAHLGDPKAPAGLYHFVNAGTASWCDLANAIFALDGDGRPRAVANPITTAQFPTAARRPANSRLATDKIRRDFGIVPRPWQAAVSDILAELRAGETQRGPTL